MEKNYRDTQSNLHISDEVISTIARCAAKEIDGVDALVADNVEWRRLLFHPHAPKAILVDMLDGVAYIRISISVRYGYRLTEVATSVQNAVRSAVQNMTGIKVGRVCIHVADIVFPTEA